MDLMQIFPYPVCLDDPIYSGSRFNNIYLLRKAARVHTLPYKYTT